jgi:hypothetical protein
MPRVRIYQERGRLAWDGTRAEVWFVAVGRYRGRRFRLRCGEGEQGRHRAERAAAELASATRRQGPQRTKRLGALGPGPRSGLKEIQLQTRSGRRYHHRSLPGNEARFLVMLV